MVCMLWSEKFSNNEPIAVVFAQHEEYGKLAAILAESLIKLQSMKTIASISFSTPEKMVALQLADLTANLTGEKYLKRNLPTNAFIKKLSGNKQKQKRHLLQLGDIRFFKLLTQHFSKPDERFRSPKFDAYRAEKADKKIREQRKSWGLLPTIKATVRRFTPKKK